MAHRGARRVAQRAESLSDPSVASALRSNLPSRSTTSGSILTASSSRVRGFAASRFVSFAPPNPIIPAAYVAGSIASRTVLATARMNAANRVFNAVTTPSARARLRDALLGRTRSGSALRVAVVATGAGVVAHVYTEEVPATGRRRLMLLDLGDEERLLRAATAAQFERLDGSFLPPSHPSTQRVAGILWKLVNRLDPALVVGTSPITHRTASTHPLLAEGATWSLHVYDSPEVNASISPGGHIFVSAGLIRACGRDDGRLAFVLAHEMGHRIARHVAEHASIEMLKTIGVSVGWALAAMFGADFLGGAVTAAAMVGAEAAAELALSLPYSRTMEYEADEIGMRLLTGACFDPDAGPRMMSTLEAFAVERRRLTERESATRDGSAGKSVMRVNGDDEHARKEMERYLSTHPLNEERIAAMRERAPRLFKSASNSDCGAYVAALQSSMRSRHRRLPPNAHDANKGKVFIPTSKWRARYVRELDVEHSTERGMNRVLDRRIKTSDKNAASAGARGAMTGPLGRFDDRRMRALLARPDTEAGAKAREDSAAAFGSEGTHSRGWRGPVRRKVELSKVELSKASVSDGVEASGVRDEASRGDAEEGTELGELVGMYWSGSGARRAVRRAAAA